jgi:hypothetical protein
MSKSDQRVAFGIQNQISKNDISPLHKVWHLPKAKPPPILYSPPTPPALLRLPSRSQSLTSKVSKGPTFSPRLTSRLPPLKREIVTRPVEARGDGPVANRIASRVRAWTNRIAGLGIRNCFSRRRLFNFLFRGNESNPIPCRILRDEYESFDCHECGVVLWLA